MSEYEEDFEEYADDFEGEAEVDEAEEASEAPALVLVVPALAVSPPPTTVEPEAPRPKAGRRGAAQPPPSVAMALASDEPASEAVVVGGEGGARAWAEISWADLELGEPFARGTSGEIRAARWRGARVAAKSLFGARSAKSADQESWRRGYEEYMCEILTMSAMAHPHVLKLHGAILQPDLGRCAMVLELCDCSLFELLHSPVSQLLAPTSALRADGARDDDDDDDDGGGGGAALRRPSAARAIAVLLGCDGVLASAAEPELSAALEAAGPAGCDAALLDRRALARLLAEVADALAYAHALFPAIVHRDVKSHNILIVAGGAAGGGASGGGAAAAARGGGAGSGAAGGVRVSARLCDWGLVGTATVDAGTPAYMAPELWRRGAFSKSVDVYALGCVLAETWGGAVPFDGVEPAEIRRRVLAGERPQMPSAAPSVLCALAEACMSDQPALRPSAAEAADALYEMSRALPIAPARFGGARARPGSAMPRRAGPERAVAQVPAQYVNAGLSDSLDSLMR